MENTNKDPNIEAETPEMSETELDEVSGGLIKSVGSSRKAVQNENKLGNFEIQDLMSQYNQAQTLASSVLKKQSDTNSGVIGKI